MNRDRRVALAQDTLAMLKAGVYTNSRGQLVELADALTQSLAGTQLILPEQWPRIMDAARNQPRAIRPAVVRVTGETTLQAAYRLVVQERLPRVLALNFASARNPGGGFLNGSQAQEESLARASGLYPTLLQAEEYYRANRRHTGTLYTDHAILSPEVPVFRLDDGTLLDAPHAVSFLTMPAPNRGAMLPDSPDVAAIPEVFCRRIGQVLALAVHAGYRTLVLGAWGCGAFRNDPMSVAGWFAEALTGPESWNPWFEHLCFAVFDTTSDARVRRPFEKCLRGTEGEAA